MFETVYRAKESWLGFVVGVITLWPGEVGHVWGAEGFRPSWRLAAQAGGKATAGIQQGKETYVRVDVVKPGNETWAINLVFPCPPIEKGKAYRVKARMRADRSRVATLSASKDGPPFGSVGLFRQIELTTQWKDFSFDFEASSSQNPARIYLDLGGHLGNVELSSLVLEQADHQTILFPSEPAEVPKPEPSTISSPTAANPSAAKTDGWEFSTDGVSARCRYLSVDPWGIEVRVIEGSANPAAVMVKRRMTLGGPKPTMEVKTNGPAEVRYRILLGQETRESTFSIPEAGNHRVELDLGGLPGRGAVEFQFLLGEKVLDWELRD